MNYNSKINLYKDNLIKFIELQNNKIIKIENIDNIDFIIGILFLTEMNRNCKNNKINIHGYYLSYSFINLFNKIKNKLLKSEKITIDDINHFWLSLSNNIDYLNSRVDSTNNIKNKINTNLTKLIIEILPLINNLIHYKKKHNIKKINIIKLDLENNDKNITSNLSNESSSSFKINTKLIKHKYCNIDCYDCWVNNILSKFFYILLITAKFMGSGIYFEPNLKRLSEYYSNIFYTYIKSFNLENINSKIINVEIFENYMNYKNKLNYSLLEMKLNSETIDEIINYIDNIIIKNIEL